ncbi:MAG: DEAD/DEAH box helicase [Paludibacteraceae bacterium]|nr:DEAD/DEAH box helicase [Paludibacteraceae bacterium]
MYSDILRVDNKLRPYQQEAKMEIFSSWDECDNVMFQMPTGTGKTRLFTSIIGDYKIWSVLNSIDSKILIVAHRIELIEQISESLTKYSIPHGIIAGGKERDLRNNVLVASIQTLTHHTNIDVAKDLNVGLVIIDEAHHSMASSYRKLWTMYATAKKLGVTATPWRMNNSGFSSIYDKLILSKSIKEFIEIGWLAPYNYYSINHNSSLYNEINTIDEFDIEGDYKVSALERVMDNSSIRAQLLDSYLKLAKGKKGIIYSISRKHSDHICEEYQKAGISIVRIDSKTPKNERTLYVKRFKEGSIDIIVNVDIFSEGFDCPDIEFIQLARPTKSLVKYLQQVGRGLRPTSGKNRCIILDNVGLHLTFGLPDEDRAWENDFIGEPNLNKDSKNKNYNQLSNVRERRFDEGDCEMSLIESVQISDVSSKQKEIPILRDKDLDLLNTLYFEKKCSLEILKSVFDTTEDVIKESIKSIEKDKR